MKIVMNLPVEASVFFNQLQQSAMADIRQHTGREPLAKSLQGFSYEKNWPNGRKARLTITEFAPNSVYAYELATPSDDLSPLSAGKSRLVYEEALVARTARGAANNRTSGFLLGWLRKRRFKKMARQMCAI